MRHVCLFAIVINISPQEIFRGDQLYKVKTTLDYYV